MTRSKGHLMWDDADREWYVYDGAIYVAPRSSVLDVRTGCRIGRFECSAEHALRFADVYGDLLIGRLRKANQQRRET